MGLLDRGERKDAAAKKKKIGKHSKVRAMHVRDISGETLQGEFRGNVVPGTELFTDAAPGYAGLHSKIRSQCRSLSLRQRQHERFGRILDAAQVHPQGHLCQRQRAGRPRRGALQLSVGIRGRETVDLRRAHEWKRGGVKEMTDTKKG